MKNKDIQKSVIDKEVEMLTKKIQLETEKRVKECFLEVQKVLTKYKCEISPSMILTADGIKANVDIVPIIPKQK